MLMMASINQLGSARGRWALHRPLFRPPSSAFPGLDRDNMAGPSAADVRSILSLPNPSTSGPSQPRKQPGTTERARKPEGISRELYSLIGPSAPTLAAQLVKPRLKQKPNLGGGGRVKWYVKPCRHAPTMVDLGSGNGGRLIMVRARTR